MRQWLRNTKVELIIHTRHNILTSGESLSRRGYCKLIASNDGGRSTHILTIGEGPSPSSRQLVKGTISEALHSGSQQQLISQTPAVKSHWQSQSNWWHSSSLLLEEVVGLSSDGNDDCLQVHPDGMKNGVVVVDIADVAVPLTMLSGIV